MFYGTQQYATVLIKARHWFIYWYALNPYDDNYDLNKVNVKAQVWFNIHSKHFKKMILEES